MPPSRGSGFPGLPARTLLSSPWSPSVQNRLACGGKAWTTAPSPQPRQSRGTLGRVGTYLGLLIQNRNLPGVPPGQAPGGPALCKGHAART